MNFSRQLITHVFGFRFSELFRVIQQTNSAGSTATVALLHSLDEPRNPFFASEELHLILAHCGDTRALLCTVPEGTAVRLTETVSYQKFPATDLVLGMTLYKSVGRADVNNIISIYLFFPLFAFV